MDNVDSVDKCLPGFINYVEFRRNPYKASFYPGTHPKAEETKNPHSFPYLLVENYVDNVDKLYSQQIFSDFYYISGSHSYQQVAVNTIF